MKWETLNADDNDHNDNVFIQGCCASVLKTLVTDFLKMRFFEVSGWCGAVCCLSHKKYDKVAL